MILKGKKLGTAADLIVDLVYKLYYKWNQTEQKKRVLPVTLGQHCRQQSLVISTTCTPAPGRQPSAQWKECRSGNSELF